MSESDPPFDEPVVLPPEDVLDLHPFQPKDIPSVVEEYLEECQRSGFRRSVSFTAKAQAYNAPLSDLFWINIRRFFLSKMPQRKPAVGEPLSSACWLIKNRLLEVDLCNDAIKDILPHAWITVDVAVFSADSAIGSPRLGYGNID